MKKVTCIILAGGKGSRLFPLTEHRAKPAVRFGGSYRLIDIPISNAMNCGIQDIYIYTQYAKESLEEHICKNFPEKRIFPSQITMVHHSKSKNIDPEWFKGTADAVRKNASTLETMDSEYFLILSGDQLYTMDLSQLIESAKRTRAELVIATLPVSSKEAHRLGIMKVDTENRIVDFIEKPQSPEVLDVFALPEKKDQYLASMGIYLFKKETLLSLIKEQGDDFGKDLIPIQVKRRNTFAYIFNGYWEDIGTIPSFYRANLALLDQTNCLDTADEKFPIHGVQHSLPTPQIHGSLVKRSLISQGTILAAKRIVCSIIGMNTQILEGSIIEDSIILGGDQEKISDKGTVIGKNCHIKKAIIDECCHIGNNVQLVNKDNHQTYDGNGIYIRDGIMIVTSGSRIPDNFVL